MSPARLCITTTFIPTVQGAPNKKPELEVVSDLPALEPAGLHQNPDHLLAHPAAVGLDIVLQDLGDHAFFKGLPLPGDQRHLAHLIEPDHQQQKQRQHYQRRRPALQTIRFTGKTSFHEKVNSVSRRQVAAERPEQGWETGQPSLVRA